MIKIGELRPNANNTQAVTVTLDKEDAEKLVKDGIIRVGVVNCTVEKRIKVTKCRRCWSYEHTATECTGTDRSKFCYKCGKDGHAAKDCTDEVACPICQTKGHITGSGKCPAFRRALNQIRREQTYSRLAQGKFPPTTQYQEEKYLSPSNAKVLTTELKPLSCNP